MKLSARLAGVNWMPQILTPAVIILLEALWFYPWLIWLGQTDLVGGDGPSLSPVSVAVILGGAYLGTRYILGRPWPVRWVRLGIIGYGLLLTLGVLRAEYHGDYGLLDWSWFGYAGGLVQNALSDAGGIIIALPAAAFLWWRGIAHGRRSPEVGDIHQTFVLGVVAFVLLIVVWRLGEGPDSIEELAATVGPLVAAFFFTALSAMALVNLTRIRLRIPREESTGAFIRRWLPTLLVTATAIVLFGLAIATIFSPNSVAFLRDAMETAVRIVFQGVLYIVMAFGYIATAIIWVINWIINAFRGVGTPVEPEAQEAPVIFEFPDPIGMPDSEPIPDSVIMILQWVLFGVAALVVLFFLVRAVSRFRTSRRREETGDISESLWSLESFMDDLRLFLSAIRGQFHRKRRVATAVPAWVLSQAPESRLDIREIYRRLLYLAGRIGSGKRKYETPNEYQRRLGPTLPEGSRQLSELTALYVSVRYGDEETPGTEIDRANGLWASLLDVLRRPVDQSPPRPRRPGGSAIRRRHPQRETPSEDQSG